MRKEYIKPAIKQYSVHATAILEGSVTSPGLNDGYSNPSDPVMSKEYNDMGFGS